MSCVTYMSRHKKKEKERKSERKKNKSAPTASRLEYEMCHIYVKTEEEGE